MTEDTWLPQETLDAVRDYVGFHQGPADHPGRWRHPLLNVALRQQLDLYVCQRPVRWFEGVPSPVKKPGDVDMVIFRENSEDIYAGVEWRGRFAGSGEGHQVPHRGNGRQEDPLHRELRHRHQPVSQEGTKRLVRKALQYAVDNDRSSVTLVTRATS